MMMFLMVAAASTQSPVVVSALTTPQLAEECRGKDTDTTASFCTGYIIGVFDTLSVAHQICPSPTHASTIEAVAAARKYLRTHRRKWSSAPSFVVRESLRATFACKRI